MTHRDRGRDGAPLSPQRQCLRPPAEDRGHCRKRHPTEGDWPLSQNRKDMLPGNKSAAAEAAKCTGRVCLPTVPEDAVRFGFTGVPGQRTVGCLQGDGAHELWEAHNIWEMGAESTSGFAPEPPFPAVTAGNPRGGGGGDAEQGRQLGGDDTSPEKGLRPRGHTYLQTLVPACLNRTVPGLRALGSCTPVESGSPRNKESSLVVRATSGGPRGPQAVRPPPP